MTEQERQATIDHGKRAQEFLQSPEGRMALAAAEMDIYVRFGEAGLTPEAMGGLHAELRALKRIAAELGAIVNRGIDAFERRKAEEKLAARSGTSA